MGSHKRRLDASHSREDAAKLHRGLEQSQRDLVELVALEVDDDGGGTQVSLASHATVRYLWTRGEGVFRREEEPARRADVRAKGRPGSKQVDATRTTICVV